MMNAAVLNVGRYKIHGSVTDGIRIHVQGSVKDCIRIQEFLRILFGYR